MAPSTTLSETVPLYEDLFDDTLNSVFDSPEKLSNLLGFSITAEQVKVGDNLKNKLENLVVSEEELIQRSRYRGWMIFSKIDGLRATLRRLDAIIQDQAPFCQVHFLSDPKILAIDRTIAKDYDNALSEILASATALCDGLPKHCHDNKLKDLFDAMGGLRLKDGQYVAVKASNEEKLALVKEMYDAVVDE